MYIHTHTYTYTHTHIMAYYTTIGMSEVMPFTTIRMGLEMIILSDQTQITPRQKKTNLI